MYLIRTVKNVFQGDFTVPLFLERRGNIKMMDRVDFMETLREVGEIVKTSAQPLSREEILSYFQQYELDDTKKEMIFEYLLSAADTSNVNDGQESDSSYESENTLDECEEEWSNVTGDEKSLEELMPKTAMFQMYLEELNQIKKYTDEQVNQMCEKLCQGDASVINILSEVFLEKVYEMSKKHLSEKYSLEDVIQEGNMGLFLELTRICEEKDRCDVVKNVTEQIELSIKSYISEITQENDIQNTVIGRAQLVSEARKYLTEKNGEIPSDVELADFTNIPLSELNSIIMFIDKADIDKL